MLGSSGFSNSVMHSLKQVLSSWSCFSEFILLKICCVRIRGRSQYRVSDYTNANNIWYVVNYLDKLLYTPAVASIVSVNFSLPNIPLCKLNYITLIWYRVPPRSTLSYRLIHEEEFMLSHFS